MMAVAYAACRNCSTAAPPAAGCCRCLFVAARSRLGGAAVRGAARFLPISDRPGGRFHSDEEQPTPAENIEALISAGQEEGLIEEQDRKLIQSVVEFGDKVVREGDEASRTEEGTDLTEPL